MACIHGAKYKKYCKRCQAPKIRRDNENKRQLQISAKLDEVIDGYIEMHVGSYARRGSFFNVHIYKNGLIRELTKLILKDL